MGDKLKGGKMVAVLLCYAVGGGDGGCVYLFSRFGSGRLVSLEWKSEESLQILLMDHLYLMMKQFYPDGRGLFINSSTPSHRAKELTERFPEDVNGHPSQQISTKLNIHGRLQNR